MILTEAEALMKECRIGGMIYHRVDEIEARQDFPKCIASRCCHWRWNYLRRPGMGSEPQGYCGVAGVPETK